MALTVFKKILYSVFTILGFLPFYILTLCLAVIARVQKSNSSETARVVFGPSPIINNKYWSEALKKAGYNSQTFMMGYSSKINKKADYDEYYYERYPFLPPVIRRPFLFWESLFRFDVFVLSFEGWILKNTAFWEVEPGFLKLAGKKIVVIPYGSDAYVYRNTRSPPLVHGLLMSYPGQARIQDEIERRVRLWVKSADCMIPAIMGIDGIGRWDVPCLSPVCIDTALWTHNPAPRAADGTKGTVWIAHAPNHTGFKGTEFIIDVVKKLKEDGLNVELKLLQNIQNDDVRKFFHEEADILVEQLIVTGHGLNAVEAMASGLPVISNLEDETYTSLFRRWSYLNECPIVSADPENVLEQLRMLVTRPALRKELGQAGRAYVEKYHSYEAAGYLFSHILKYVYGEVDSIINLYHPLSGEYKRDVPRILPPLVKNRIVD